MQTEQPRSVEARLRGLERTNRFWRRATLLVAGALGAGVLAASSTPGEEVIAAERFELVDSEGRVRAEMAIDEDGSAGFFVLDPEGRVRANLIYDATQAAMYLLDDQETIRVGAAQYSHGGGGFALHGEKSEGAAVLYLKEKKGSLTFYDAEGLVRSRLPE